MQPAYTRKIRNTFKWVLWVLLIQFVFINISGVLYAYKLTHFYEPLPSRQPRSKNVFTKTWKLFRGPNFQRVPDTEFPHFPYDLVKLAGMGSHQIDAWYMPAESSRGTIIMIHGLGANKSFLLDEAYEFRYLGFNVMMIDLRAHGNSDGNTTTLGVREPAEVKLAYDYIAAKGERNIVLYGVSLGAVVVAKAMYDYHLTSSRIILDMPFENLEKLLEGRARILGFPEEPFGVLVTFWSGVERGFNGFKHCTTRYVQKITCPVLMQYGALDKLVTRGETDAVFKNISSTDKKLVIYERANHESFLRNDAKLWRKEVTEFLSK